MRLNINGKTELKHLIAYLPEIKMSFESETLEQLIFEEEKLGEKILKKIVWQGPGLSKIDLSKVSFDNVIWDGDVIDLSNTNAIINFAKGAQTDSKKSLIIANINLSNVDLSKSGIEYIAGIRNCTFYNNNLSQEQLSKLISNILLKSIFNTGNTFEEYDLSKIEINMDENRVYPEVATLENNSFKNTGLNLTINSSSLKSRLFKNLLKGKNRNLNGIYINGNLITSNFSLEKEEQLTRKREIN